MKLNYYDKFERRHIGPRKHDEAKMLETIVVKSVSELISKTLPKSILLKDQMELDDAMTEYEFLNHLGELASKNKIYKSYIGMGYSDTIVPSVILRNVLENPGWYTQYTPYQAEISQGRLEALLNFQTMVMDLTAMDLANASLLDEGTAASEAMLMLFSSRKKEKKNANVFLVADTVFEHTIDVLHTRAEPFGIEVKVCDLASCNFEENVFGLLVQYPDADGVISNYSELISKAKAENIFVTVAADLLSLTLLTPPGEMGADVVVGTTQRFGVPMGFGGPHAAYFATREEFKRNIPGRIIGASIDSNGKPALRMALQTREQHIKRERATSNICTAQVLLAIMASFYACYHGPKGLKYIAQKINYHTSLLADNLKVLGYPLKSEKFFDTLKIETDRETQVIINKLAMDNGINLRYYKDGGIGISLGESVSETDIENLVKIFSEAKEKQFESLVKKENYPSIPDDLARTSTYLEHPVFALYHSETEMVRYMKRLERKDLSLTTSMIPLGSCTMKLNAATEMLGVSWKEFANIHPFVPRDQAEGYFELIRMLEHQLNEITGFSATSLQPNSGAQGEYTGLMVIREWHKSRGEEHRNVVLIPSSAHGTNPASAVMAGGKVVVVKCDDNGNIDVEDLKEKAEKHSHELSSLMVTYPSTHGVFEEEIIEICDIIHQYGGQVYMDGANLNAQVGLTNPKIIGADVCHLNLHKTFTIPHGGGGPGMGPIAVAEHLAPFLPGHKVVHTGGEKAIGAVSAAPYGSANILLISYAYIKLMGADGLTNATINAIMNANYIKARLQNEFKVLYSGRNGFIGHELIFDMREFKHSINLEVEDIAKRLMDYGYHAPTVSFPVPGTLMVEPTESEALEELDRFCDAMLAIRNEIKEIENGEADKENNVLKNAPHTAETVISDNWNRPYSREKAAYPTDFVRLNKFWPSVGRVNNAHGDRNLVCSCLPISEYEND